MSTTPPEVVSPLSEPERHLHRRLRERTRVVAEAIENDTTPDVIMANAENERSMEDYTKPSIENYGNGINQPEINENFEIKSSTIHMVENSIQFHGLQDEDPHSHISRFL